MATGFSTMEALMILKVTVKGRPKNSDDGHLQIVGDARQLRPAARIAGHANQQRMSAAFLDVCFVLPICESVQNTRCKAIARQLCILLTQNVEFGCVNSGVRRRDNGG
jgi:hypothetical protein